MLKWNAAQAFAGGAADDRRVGGRTGQRQITRHYMEIREAQLDADGAAEIALALQVVGDAVAESGK